MTQLLLNTFNNDEIDSMSPEDLKLLIEQMNAVAIASKNMNQTVIEKTLAPLILKYDIKTIQLDPHYFFNDDGYSFINCMTYINQEDVSGNQAYVPLDKSLKHKATDKISFDLLQHKIDLALENVVPLLTHSLVINVPDLRKRYAYLNLESELEEKTDKKKTPKI